MYGDAMTDKRTFHVQIIETPDGDIFAHMPMDEGDYRESFGDDAKFIGEGTITEGNFYGDKSGT